MDASSHAYRHAGMPTTLGLAEAQSPQTKSTDAFTRVDEASGRLASLISRLNSCVERLAGSATEDASATPRPPVGSLVGGLHRAVDDINSLVDAGHDLVERIERVLP